MSSGWISDNRSSYAGTGTNSHSGKTSQPFSWSEFLQNPGLAWIVLLLSILLTYLGWKWSNNSVQQRAKERFQLEINNAQTSIQLRMRSYENVLRGGEGLFISQGFPTRTQWNQYVNTLRLDEYYPGILGLGFSQWIHPDELDTLAHKVRRDGYQEFTIKPEGVRSEYSAIVYLEPLSGRNLRAFGYDMWSEPTRKTAMARARDLEQPALSGKVTLVQESGTNVQAGVLMYIPVYKPDTPHSTIQERQTNLLGWVYSPFRMNDLMKGILGQNRPYLGFRIYDGTNQSPVNLLYESDVHLPSPGTDPNPIPWFREDRLIQVGGRTWTLDFHSQPTFEAAYSNNQPLLIAVGGALIDGILFLALWSLSRRQSDLKRFNKELERRVTEQTREAQDLRAALDHHAIVAITTPDGAITYANEKFVQIAQYSTQELLGQNHRLVNSGTHPKEFFRNIWQTISRGKVWHGEICNKAKDGSLYWVETTIVPILDTDGKPRNYISIRTDITPRKRVEDQLLKAKEAAESANKAKSEFLATMSHEIRTPMNGVLGFTNLLLDTQLDTDQRQFVTTIKNSGEALLTLINDILDFSKVESGKLILENNRFDLIKAVEEVAELVSPKVHDKGLELALRIDPNIPAYVVSDAGRVRQVILNLVGNAVKFTEKGHILIDLSMVPPPPIAPGSVNSTTNSKLPSEIRIRVIDTGLGIPPEKQGQLFQHFTQADASTTRRFGGTGLGLAISKHLVELMGGTIGLESKPGVGSTFYFTLPTPPHPYPLAHTAPAPRELVDLRVIVIDPTPIHHQLFSETFARWKMDCLCTESAHQGLKALHDAQTVGNPFHVAILDSKLPENGAVTLAQTLRSDSLLKRTLIICSGSPATKDLNLTQSTGPLFDAFLAKPILRINGLTESLLEAIAQRRQQTNFHPSLPSTHFIRPDGNLHPNNSANNTSSTPTEHLRVLLAEDNATNQLLAKRLLGKLNCTVDVASNGREAVAMIKKLPYHIIFMDCHMPEMDGFRATIEIRKMESERAQSLKPGSPSSPRIPIVAVTASARETDRLECLASGMDDFITKPIHPDALRKAIEKWGRKNLLAP